MCKYRPKFRIKNYLFGFGEKDLQCKYCHQPMEMSFNCCILLLIILALLFVSGLVCLLFQKEINNTVVSVFIINLLLYHLLKILIIIFGKYNLRL